MRWMDYFLQNWRCKVAEKHICAGDVLLDVGCYDGSFLTRLQNSVSRGVGVDIILASNLSTQVRNRLTLADVTSGLPFSDNVFDVVSLLAVFEHLQKNELVVQELYRILVPGGRVILTVPGGQVDRVLNLLIAVGIADGMSLEEHYGYEAGETPTLFERYGFSMLHWHRFQFGLNNLFIFKKP